MEKDLGFEGLIDEKLISKIVEAKVSEAFDKGVEKGVKTGGASGVKKGVKELEKELENTKVKLDNVVANVEKVKVKVNDPNLRKELETAVEKSVDKPIKTNVTTTVDINVSKTTEKQAEQASDKVQQLLQEAMSKHKKRWGKFDLLGELGKFNLDTKSLEKELEKLYNKDNFGSPKTNKQFVSMYSAHQALGGKPIREYEQELEYLTKGAGIDPEGISTAEKHDMEFFSSLFDTVKKLIPMLQTANAEVKEIKQNSSTSTSSQSKDKNKSGVLLGDESNQSNDMDYLLDKDILEETFDDTVQAIQKFNTRLSKEKASLEKTLLGIKEDFEEVRNSDLDESLKEALTSDDYDSKDEIYADFADQYYERAQELFYDRSSAIQDDKADGLYEDARDYDQYLASMADSYDKCLQMINMIEDADLKAEKLNEYSKLYAEDVNGDEKDRTKSLSLGRDALETIVEDYERESGNLNEQINNIVADVDRLNKIEVQASWFEIPNQTEVLSGGDTNSSLQETEEHLQGIIRLLNDIIEKSKITKDGFHFVENAKAVNLSTLSESDNYSSNTRTGVNILDEVYDDFVKVVSSKLLDTFIHTHPESLASFSDNDIESAFKSLELGITKQIIVASEEMSFLDVGRIKKELDKNNLSDKFIEEYKSLVEKASDNISGQELQYKLKEILLNLLDAYNIDSDSVYKSTSIDKFANAFISDDIKSLPSARLGVDEYNSTKQSYDWIEKVAKDDVGEISKLITEYEKIKNSISDLLVKYQNATISSTDEIDELSKIRNRIEKQLKGLGYGNNDSKIRGFSFEQAKQELENLQNQVNQTPLSLVEESSGQLSMFEGVEEQQKEIKQSVEQTNNSIEGQINLIDYLNEQASKSNQPEFIQESSGQLAMFEGLEESQKEVETSIEKTNDAIKGQITIEEYQKNQVKETANAYDELTKKLNRYYELRNKDIKGELGKKKPSEISEFEKLKVEIQNATKAEGKYSNATGEAAKAQERFNDALENTSKSLVTSMSNHQTSEVNKIKNSDGKIVGYDKEIERIFEKIKELNALEVNITSDDDIEQLKTLNAEITKMIKNAKGAEFKQADITGIVKLEGQIDKTLFKNTAAPAHLKKELNELKAEVTDAKARIESVNEVEFNRLKDKLTELQSKIESTGKSGDSLATKIKRKFKDVAAYFATYVSIQDAIQIIRQGFETIKEYDVALTEMNKVSDESIQTLKEFQKESFGLADSIGATASQIQNSTADWMRLGESLEEAKQSAQDANILFNVSEFETIDEATESLVSMSQAFKDLEKGEIVDVVNNLGNNFAISTDGLATALKDSASSLQTAQNDFYEAAALTTAANTVVQDPAKVGAGLRTIALRLTGTEAAREELQALGEDVDDFVITTTSKMDQQIRDLTKTQGNFGVSLLDMNGNYRSTYDVLLDIAKVWDKIAEEDLVTGENRQNALLEMMAGKNRSNILASILQSPDVLEEAYAYALDSEGSALKENEAYLESIQGHLDQLKNSWDNLWINENNREVITFFLDLAKSVLDAANEFGALNTVLVGGGGIFAAIKAFQGNGRPKCRVSKLNMPLVA